MNNFPHGVEIVTGAVIKNSKGEILLTRSPKWSNRWVIPGGHVEPGETIAYASKREAEEETGLTLSEGEFFYWGEIIHPSAFHRLAHFIYFDYLYDAISESVQLDKIELTEYAWIDPEKAFDYDIPTPTDITIKRFLEYIKK